MFKSGDIWYLKPPSRSNSNRTWWGVIDHECKKRIQQDQLEHHYVARVTHMSSCRTVQLQHVSEMESDGTESLY